MTWMPDNTAELDRVERRLQADLMDAWAKMLGTKAGRFIVWSILERCHLFESTFTGNAQSAFLEGERNIALHILKERVLPTNPELLATMMMEDGERRDQIEHAIAKDEA